MKNYHEIIEHNLIQKKYKIDKKIKFLLNFNNFQLTSYLEYYLNIQKVNIETIDSEYDQVYQELKTFKNFSKIDYLVVGNDYNDFQNNNENLNFRLENFSNQIELLKNIKKKIQNLK